MGDINQFGALLHEGWELKRSLGCGIATTMLMMVASGAPAGAIGGKLLGAGGGGFLLLVAPPWRHRAIARRWDDPANCHSGSPDTEPPHFHPQLIKFSHDRDSAGDH